MRIFKKVARVALLLMLVVFMFSTSLSLGIFAEEPAPQGDDLHFDAPWYTIDYDGDALKVTIDPNIKHYTNLSKDALNTLKDQLIETVKTIVIGNRSDMEEEIKDSIKEMLISEGEYPEGTTPADISDSDINETEWVKGLFKKFGITDVSSVDPAVIIPTLISAGYSVQELNAVDWDRVYNALSGTAEEKTAIIEKVQEVIQEEEEKQESGTSGAQGTIDSISSLLFALNSVSVDGYAVYANQTVSTSALLELVKTLPTPTEIAAKDDSEMNFSFDVVIDSVFGQKEFTFNVGFDGDCSQIRRVMQVISNSLSVSRDTDDTLKIGITVPEAFTRALLRAANSDSLSDTVKQKVFTALTKDADDFYALYETLTFDDILELVRNTDFTGLLSISEVKKITNLSFIKDRVDFDSMTSDEIADKLAEYEDYYNRAASLFERLFAKLPESYRSLTLMDFYKGNGEFSASVNKTVTNIDVEKVLSKISASKAALITSYLGEFSYNVKADVKINVPNLHSITYMVDDTAVRSGLLPTGANVVFFADMTEYNGVEILRWEDADGNVYSSETGMPEKDLTLYAILAFDLELTPSDDLSITYDAATHEISVTATTEGKDPVYTYQWYKNGVAIEGATSATYLVKDVADSGTYTCEVGLTVYEGTMTKTSDEITVTIEKAEIDLSGAAWNYTAPFIYDGEEKSVAITGLDALITATYTDDAKLAVGDYTATVAFTYDTANYKIVNSPALTLSWEIAKATIDLNGVAWDYTAAFTYDGQTKTVALTGIPASYASVLTVTYGENAKTAAGTYTATATLVYDTDSYTVTNAPALSCTFVINKATIDLNGVAWDYTAAFTYDGQTKTVALTGIPASYASVLTVTYGENAKTAAGTYTATATLVYDTDSYTVTNAPALSCTFVINKATIDLSSIGWSYTAPFTYDGAEKTVTVTNLPAGYTLVPVYANNAKTAAGTYTASVTFTGYDADNYTLNLGTADEIEWTINKATINLASVAWNYSAAFVYDGTEKSVALTGIPAGYGITVNYAGDSSATAVGNYTVSATIGGYDTANYEIGNFNVAPLNWSISARPSYDMTGVSFENVTIPYDGQPHTLEITGNLPAGVTVTYVGTAGTEPGTYTFTAKFTGDPAYNAIPDMTATLTIQSYEVKKTFETEIATVEEKDGLNENFVLHSDDVTSAYKNFEIKDLDLEKGKKAEVRSAYDIFFDLNNVGQSGITGSFTVRLLVPENLRERDLMVVHIADNGNVTDMNASRDGDYLKFDTTHFSVYAIAEVVDDNAPAGGFPWLYLILALVALLLIIVILILVFRRKDKNEEPTPTEPTEEPIEEPKEEPAEEPVEEPVEESAPEEETPEPEAVEEVPVEEELVAEEPVAEEPVEEAPAEAEEVAVASDDEIDGNYQMINGAVVPVRYRTSFMSRLIQSQGEVQDYYTVIKNALLSYKGVKARMSWNIESFNKGRQALAKINCKGKTLMLYLALVPGEYNVNKYHHSDVSEKQKFAMVPMMMRVRSARSLKYALELIEELMKKQEIALGESSNTDFHLPYETTDALIEKKLIKIVLPAGMKPDSDANYVKADIGEFIGDRDTTDDQNATGEEAPAANEEVGVTAEDEIGGNTQMINGAVVPVRYRTSFMSRLIQSQGEVQDYYTEIKNALLSYKGVKARMSWNIETFNKGRQPLAKINCKGKTLMLYLALEPSEYNVNKYHFSNLSEKPKFAMVPLMMKVRSARSLKYALELIEELMKKQEIPFGKPSNTDFHLPYETTEALVEKKYVKMVLPAGMKPDSDVNYVKADIGEFIGDRDSDTTAD
ncbi:MAG: hypothetical protein MJ082_03775 [Clostridia bacterium]|nr:hypothetical protein [Clostridia bacterium]